MGLLGKKIKVKVLSFKPLHLLSKDMIDQIGAAMNMTYYYV